MPRIFSGPFFFSFVFLYSIRYCFVFLLLPRRGWLGKNVSGPGDPQSKNSDSRKVQYVMTEKDDDKQALVECFLAS